MQGPLGGHVALEHQVVVEQQPLHAPGVERFTHLTETDRPRTTGERTLHRCRGERVLAVEVDRPQELEGMGRDLVGGGGLPRLVGDQHADTLVRRYQIADLLTQFGRGGEHHPVDAVGRGPVDHVLEDLLEEAVAVLVEPVLVAVPI